MHWLIVWKMRYIDAASRAPRGCRPANGVTLAAAFLNTRSPFTEQDAEREKERGIHSERNRDERSICLVVSQQTKQSESELPTRGGKPCSGYRSRLFFSENVRQDAKLIRAGLKLPFRVISRTVRGNCFASPNCRVSNL